MNFTNPLYKRTPLDTSPKSQADPYMIEHDGVYYTYATNSDGVILYSSKDFDNWEYRGFVLQVDGQREYWAPSVIYTKGKFYMYYSTMPLGSDDVHDQAIRIAVCDKPDGKFEYIKDLLPPFSIDAHVVDNGYGELFIFYCNNDYESKRAGTYILLDRMTNPLEVEGNPVPVILPTIDEEIFECDRFRKGQHWHTIEGAFYFKHGGYHFVTYSGSAYTKESYFIGYSVAKGDERDLRKLKFNKYPDDNTYMPLIRKDDKVEGTGHNSIIKIGDEYYIIYHGRDMNNTDTCDTRVFRAARLLIDKDKLTALV